MISEDKQAEAFVEQFRKREAGVAELLDFYALIEEVYVAASAASEQAQPVIISNSANPE